MSISEIRGVIPRRTSWCCVWSSVSEPRGLVDRSAISVARICNEIRDDVHAPLVECLFGAGCDLCRQTTQTARMDRLQNALHSSMPFEQKRTLNGWILKRHFDILRPSGAATMQRKLLPSRSKDCSL